MSTHPRPRPEPPPAAALADETGWPYGDVQRSLHLLTELLGGGAADRGRAVAAIRALHLRPAQSRPARLSDWLDGHTPDELLELPEVRALAAPPRLAVGRLQRRADHDQVVLDRRQLLDQHPQGAQARQVARTVLPAGSSEPRIDIEALVTLREWAEHRRAVS